MKKKIYVIVLSVLAVSFLPFPLSPVFGAPKSVTLKISVPFVPFDHRTIACDYWAKLIEDRTQGRVKGELYPGGSLSKLHEADLVLSQGVVDVALAASVFMAQRYPIFKSFEFPVYSAKPEKMPAIHRAVEPMLSTALARGNIKYLFWTYAGENITTMTKRPILKLEDWKGLKIRCAGKTTAKMIRALGATPIVMPIGEVTMALQRGTMDGVFTGWPVAMALKLHEVAPHMTLYPIITIWSTVSMNMDVFKSLSSEDQRILVDAGREASLYQAVVGLEHRDSYFRNLAKLGITPHSYSEEELEKYLMKCNTVTEEFKREATPEQLKLLEILEQHP